MSNNFCPCGSVFLPKGSKHDPNGLACKLNIAKVTELEPYFDDVILLLNFEGDSIIDSSKYKWNINTDGINLLNNDSKFGNSSLSTAEGYIYLLSTVPWWGLPVGTIDPNIFNLTQGNFTIEFWIKPLELGFSNQYILDIFDHFSIRYDLISHRFTIWNNFWSPYLTSNEFSPNQWYHFAFVRENNIDKLFINGELQASIDNGESIPTFPNLLIFSKLTIGNNFYSDLYYSFNGRIDDIRITKNIARYSNNFQIPDKTFKEKTEENDILNLNLTHDKDIFLSSEQTFVTTTDKIVINNDAIQIKINDIIIHCDDSYNLSINNGINISVKDFTNNINLYSRRFGKLYDQIPFDKNILLGRSAINLPVSGQYLPSSYFNDHKLLFKFDSVCDSNDDCCDTTPNSFTLINTINSITIPCCSTTPPPPPPSGACCERGVRWNSASGIWEQYSICYGLTTELECDPNYGANSYRVWLSGQDCSSCPTKDFCDNFSLPNTFKFDLIGYGNFDGQDTQATVIKINNQYITSGIFPCGESYYLTMTCDELQQKFIYDGELSCCNQATKWIHEPTDQPLIYPNARPPMLIGYTDCRQCNNDCTTTTTTTLPPIIPCEPIYNVSINGYAFYRDKKSLVNIPGFGQQRVKCAGGHRCNRTDFMPQLILGNQTFNANSAISMNNLNSGWGGSGDRDATFSFNLPDASFLDASPKQFRLKCLNPVCHQGVTYVVLTADVSGSGGIIFNSCVTPGALTDLEYECRARGLCCLDNGNCVSDISELGCSLLAIDENTGFTWHEYTFDDPVPEGKIADGTTCEEGPCPTTYEFCIVNSNYILDNSWDIYINNEKIGNYSGQPNTNICLEIPIQILNNNSINNLKFILVQCQSDDYFEFEIRKITNYIPQVIFNGNSGYLNASYFSFGTCSDQEFERDFEI